MNSFLKIFLLLIVVIGLSNNNQGQNKEFLLKEKYVYTKMDSVIFSSILEQMRGRNKIIDIAQCFLYASYRKMGEKSVGEEKVIADFRAVDCVTYTEMVLAISAGLQKQNIDFHVFLENLKKIRYRGGVLDGYPSRLHYFSDWIYDNEQKGFVREVTKALGGDKWEAPIFYMSKNKHKYVPLKDVKKLEKIKKQEEKINEYERYYIPQEEIDKVESKIQDGDIIAITTSIKGLDITHVGFALHQGDRLHLLHASSTYDKVVISAKPLVDYLKSHKTQTGIRVLRAVL